MDAASDFNGRGTHTVVFPLTSTREQRIANHLLNKREREAFSECLVSKPVSIIIPTGMRCNSRCVFCTDRRKGSPYVYEDLTFEEFLGFCHVDSCASHIGLYAWGEPLVNPEYEKMYQYATEAFCGAYLTITTNGILFDESWARKVIAYPWSAVTFSVNAATPDTYRKLTSVSKFERVIANIRRLLELRRAEGSTSHVSLSFVALTSNIRELPAFVELAADLGADQVILQDLIILSESQKSLSLQNCPDLANSVFVEAIRAARSRGILLTPFVPTGYSQRIPAARAGIRGKV